MKPVFLALDEVLALQADQIERYGGEAGVRDPGLLSSALAMPQATFGGEWLHPTLPEMARVKAWLRATRHTVREFLDPWISPLPCLTIVGRRPELRPGRDGLAELTLVR